jgi:hypothetical protein
MTESESCSNDVRLAANPSKKGMKYNACLLSKRFVEEANRES